MRLVRLILGDHDPRSRQEIEHDIDDELEFHLEQLVAEERAAGKPPDAARQEAGRRFGSIDHYRKLCLNVNLKERIMLQRINLGLLVLVALGLGFTAWQSWAAQSRTATAVEGLTKQLAEMRATPATPNAAPAANPATVTITGQIARGGVFSLPPEGLTLQRLLAAAGWDGKYQVNVRLQRRSGTGQDIRTEISWAMLSDKVAPKDPALQPGDLVFVSDARASAEAASQTATTPAKPDEHGRIAELTFTPRVLDSFASLRDEGFLAYDSACAEAGLDKLAARSETILVVGAVDRPGVYVLDKVTTSESKVSLLDVLRAAGASPEITSYRVIRRARPESGGERTFPAATLFSSTEYLATSDTVVIAWKEKRWSDGPPWTDLQLLSDHDGTRHVYSSFTPEAAAEIKRWENYKKVVGPWQLVTQRGELLALSITDLDIIRNAIDIDEITLSPRRIIGGFLAESQASIELRSLLNDRPGPSTDFRVNVFDRPDRDLIRSNLRVNVYDRIAKNPTPLVDLPYDEAVKSDFRVPDGAFVQISHKPQ
ncbi:MAG: permease prefix domain 1-containing protein [Phycisphaerales bacterium]|nr:permease prefix domain 1-containing protein [Phycisphaerales bacterium]